MRFLLGNGEEEDGDGGFRAWICINMEESYMCSQNIILSSLYLLSSSHGCSWTKMEEEDGLNGERLESKLEKYEFDQHVRGESTHKASP